MRTLKKVLALSMVFAMAFSMMAGAAFNDQDQIDASLVEDIQLLTALEVFQGDEKGDFNPTSNVTRAQAAKMIYVLKNNGQDDEAAAFKGNSVYSDVPSGHWAEGYINYATNLGIMSGWTEGSVRKFDPNGNVTGIELTKMLLCMIGYRSDIQGYTGNGWQTNVLRDGATSAVTTNYLPTIYNAAPRQWTARLMANAINAPYVTYSRGEVVMGHATNPSKSYGEQYLGLCTVEGYLRDAGRVSLADGQISLDDDGDEIELSSKMDLSDLKAAKSSIANGENVATFKTTVDPSLLGQYVKVYYKASTLTTMDVKVYAVLATGQSKAYDKTLADVTVSKDETKEYETIKFDGYNGGSAKQYGKDKDGNARTIKLIKNLNDAEEATKPLTANINKTKDKGFDDLSATSNANIRFVDQDNDGFIDLAFLEEVKYAIVDSHNAEKNTLRLKNANGKVEKLVDGDVVNSESAYKKINFVNEVAADDVVSVTLDCTSGTKVWNVAKVEPTTGSVSGYNLDSGNYDSVTLNGESTKIAGGSKTDDYRIGGYKKSYNDNTSLLNDTTFYTDGKYIIYSKGGDSVASVGSLAYVIGTQPYTAYGSETWYAKVLLSDGTQGEYQVAATYQKDEKGQLKEDPKVNPDGFLKDGNVYSYSISDNKITLSELKEDASPNGIQFHRGVQAYNHNTKRYTIDGANKVLSEDAYLFVKSNADTSKPKYSVVKASELGKSMESNLAEGYKTDNVDFATKKINGIDTVVFGTLAVKGNAVATAAEYAFVKSAPSYTTVDGDHVAQMTVVLPNGEEQVVKDTFSNASGAYEKIGEWTDLRGKVISYDVDAAGDAENVKQISLTSYSLTNNKLTNDKWYAVRILGWNGTVANVDNGNGSESVVLNVASDVKTHIVDGPSGSRKYFNYSDGSVVETAQIEDPEDEDKTVIGNFKSAIIYVSEVNGQQVITDIFCEEDGNDINALTSVPSAN